MSARQLVFADVLAEHLDRAHSFLDNLLAASTRLVHDLLAGLAISKMAVVVTAVATRKLLAAFLVAVRDFRSTLDWSWNDLATTGAPQRLVYHDGAVSALANMALLGTRMASTFKHSSTEFHAGMLKAVGYRDTAGDLAAVDLAALLLLADTVTDDVVEA